MSTSSNIPDILDYYDATGRDYARLWSGQEARAIHFGLWQDGVDSHEASLERMNLEMARQADLEPGRLVVDLGCGVGGTDVWLAREYDATVTGVTIVPEQAEAARAAAAERGLQESCTFVVADFVDTGLPGASFDVVWTQESVSHAPDRSLVLTEARRLLRPGGVLVQEEIYRGSAPRTARSDRDVTQMCEAWKIAELPTRDEYQAQLADAGFDRLQWTDLTPWITPSLRKLRDISRVYGPLAKGAERSGRMSSTRAQNIIAAPAAWRAHKAGAWCMAITTARAPLG